MAARSLIMELTTKLCALFSLLPRLGKVKTLRWGVPKRAKVFLFKLFGAPEADTLLPTQVIDDRGTHGMYSALKWRVQLPMHCLSIHV